ncbi:MAG: PAS domain S-box-containing protein [Patiriisocius sp.]
MGVVVSDPNLKDNPVVYANSALSMITGYNKSDVYGKNCRFLQSDDLKQTAITTFRKAIKENCATTVVLRNYRKDGTLFWNIVTASPILMVMANPNSFSAYNKM